MQVIGEKGIERWNSFYQNTSSIVFLIRFFDNQMIYQYNNSFSILFHSTVSKEMSLPDDKDVPYSFSMVTFY